MEQEVVVPVEQTEKPLETVAVKPAEVVEQTQTEQPEGTTETVPQEVAEVQPQPKWKLKHGGNEVEVDESEAINFAQQGLDYTKKMQALSEWEKANQQKLQLAEQLTSDPNTVRYAIAKQLGYDPSLVMGNIQPPDPSYKDVYPEQFGRQQAQFEIASEQKQRFESAVNNILALNTQSANAAVFQKARLEHNLDDSQYQQVQNFVTQRMRPNVTGFYSGEDVNYAVSALYGRDRTAEAKLTQANNIQNIIKEASRPATVTRRAAEDLTPQQKENKAFDDFLKDYQVGWASKG